MAAAVEGQLWAMAGNSLLFFNVQLKNDQRRSHVHDKKHFSRPHCSFGHWAQALSASCLAATVVLLNAASSDAAAVAYLQTRQLTCLSLINDKKSVSKVFRRCCAGTLQALKKLQLLRARIAQLENLLLVMRLKMTSIGISITCRFCANVCLRFICLFIATGNYGACRVCRNLIFNSFAASQVGNLSFSRQKRTHYYAIN